jgi:hypothetical protein
MNVTIPDVLVIIALIIAAFEEYETRGRSPICWAVILVCVAWLWSAFA